MAGGPGGSPSPDPLLLADCGMMVSAAARRDRDAGEAEREACLALGEGLMRAYADGPRAWQDSGIGRLERLAERALATGVPAWTPRGPSAGARPS